MARDIAKVTHEKLLTESAAGTWTEFEIDLNIDLGAGRAMRVDRVLVEIAQDSMENSREAEVQVANKAQEGTILIHDSDCIAKWIAIQHTSPTNIRNLVQEVPIMRDRALVGKNIHVSISSDNVVGALSCAIVIEGTIVQLTSAELLSLALG